MRRSPLLPQAALAAGLMLGCTDQHAPLVPDNSPVPSFRTERGTAEFGIPLGDERYTLIVGHTFEDMVAICEGRIPNFQSWDVLTAIRPEGREGFEESFKQRSTIDNVVLTVFEFSPFVFGEECDLLGAPLYEGIGQAFINDNDVAFTHRGANSFVMRVSGTVTDASGQEYRLVAHYHHVAGPGTTFENFDPKNLRVDIRLTPI
jgi:hypothetical protein